MQWEFGDELLQFTDEFDMATHGQFVLDRRQLHLEPFLGQSRPCGLRER